MAIQNKLHVSCCVCEIRVFSNIYNCVEQTIFKKAQSFVVPIVIHLVATFTI